MNLKTVDARSRRKAISVIVLGATSFVIGFGLLVKDFLSIYDIAGRSSDFCESKCLSAQMATSQLSRTSTLRTIDIAVMAVGIAVTVLGLILLSRAQKRRSV